MSSTTTYDVPAELGMDARGDARRDRSASGPVGLTLCFHPELERIGEIAVLELAGGTAQIDRESPRFRHPGTPLALARGLATSFVSQRLPLRVESNDDGSVRIHPSSDPRHGSLHLPERDPLPCMSAVEIDADRLRGSGVVVVLNRTVVLLLHRLPLEPVGCDPAALLKETKTLIADARALATLAGVAHADPLARAEQQLRGANGQAAILACTAALVREAVALYADTNGPRSAALARDAARIALSAARLARSAARLDRVQNGVVGESSAISRLWEGIYALDRSDPIMLVGEQGTGKSEVARALARFSVRKGPFVYKNAANFTASVAAAELFGRKKGFLGADDAGLPGIFRSADKGVLFLDEISELPREVQPKLLDAVERGFITPVGDNEVAVDVRLITATNKDCSATELKRDLYDRLAGIQLRVPSLRDRRDDIPRLLIHFARDRWGGRLQRAPEAMDTRAEWAAGWASFVTRLLMDPWPGNVRVLRDVVRRLVLANPIAIDADDAAFIEPEWPEAAAATTPSAQIPAASGPRTTWKELVALPTDEQRARLEALLATHGSQLKAAAAIGTSGPTLNRQCKKLGLDVATLDDAQLANPPKWANTKAVSAKRNDRDRAR